MGPLRKQDGHLVLYVLLVDSTVQELGKICMSLYWVRFNCKSVCLVNLSMSKLLFFSLDYI